MSCSSDAPAHGGNKPSCNFTGMIDSPLGDFTRTALLVIYCTLPHLCLTELRKKKKVCRYVPGPNENINLSTADPGAYEFHFNSPLPGLLPCTYPEADICCFSKLPCHTIMCCYGFCLVIIIIIQRPICLTDNYMKVLQVLV